MAQQIGLVTLVVDDYDRAIAYFTQVLGFALVEDRPMGAEKRWVVVAPQGGPGGDSDSGGGPGGGSGHASGLLLAQAADERQRQAIGSQTGGRVFLFLNTDNFQRDYAAYTQRGVAFVEEPRSESYGTVAVFVDLYGNRWDLIEPRA